MFTRTKWKSLLLITYLYVVASNPDEGHQPIIAYPGRDIILPCHLELDLGKFTLEWSKVNPVTAQDKITVYIYRHSKEEPITNELYIGRTHMFPKHLKEGNCSLLIKNVTSEHQGFYTFFMPKLPENSKNVNLVVVPNYPKTPVPPQKMEEDPISVPPKDTDTKVPNDPKTPVPPQKMEEVPASVPPKDTDDKVNPGYWVLLALFLILILIGGIVGIVYVCKKQGVDLKEHITFRFRRCPQEDIENQQDS